jgi:sigma-B regulation protein RsbU (phosphoserine phosphatase)
MNLNLEHKVSERTEELEAAMNELEAMNHSLTDAVRDLESSEDARRRDLALAGSVQLSFLPKIKTDYTSYDIAFVYRPWGDISGDFFDIYEDGDDLTGIGLFDVSGHGVSSGLLTLLAKSIITRHINRERDRRLSTIVEDINAELIQEIGQIDNYITGIFLRFIGDSFEYVNCAHPDIVFRTARSGKAGQIMDKLGDSYRSLFLGIDGMNSSFPSVTIKLNPGDCMLLYTDVMIEAKNKIGESYSEMHLMESMRKAPAGGARNILDHIMKNYNDFIGGAPLKDDLTAILIQKK